MRTTAPWNKSARDEHLQMAKDDVFLWWMSFWFWGRGVVGRGLYGAVRMHLFLEEILFRDLERRDAYII